MQISHLIKIIFFFPFFLLIAVPAFCSAVEDGCMRGMPYPVFSKSRAEIFSRKFTPQSSHEAEENVELKSGETIQIKHWGCEYYVITFTVKSIELMKNGVSNEAAYREVYLILRKLVRLKADSVFDLRLAAITLEKSLRKKQAPELSEELSVDGDGTDFLQTVITINRAERKGNLGLLEFSFAKGPL
jgi:hypothetical protein